MTEYKMPEIENIGNLLKQFCNDTDAMTDVLDQFVYRMDNRRTNVEFLQLSSDYSKRQLNKNEILWKTDTTLLPIKIYHKEKE